MDIRSNISHKQMKRNRKIYCDCCGCVIQIPKPDMNFDIATQKCKKCFTLYFLNDSYSGLIDSGVSAISSKKPSAVKKQSLTPLNVVYDDNDSSNCSESHLLEVVLTPKKSCTNSGLKVSQKRVCLALDLNKSHSEHATRPSKSSLVSSGTQTVPEHSNDSFLNGTWKNVLNSQKSFQITNDCYVHRVYDLFEQARRQSLVILCSPFFDNQWPTDRRLFMLLEFRNRDPKALANFTISWAFLRSLLAEQPGFKDIFRVFVDVNLVQRHDDFAALMLLMKGFFEETQVVQK